MILTALDCRKSAVWYNHVLEIDVAEILMELLLCLLQQGNNRHALMYAKRLLAQNTANAAVESRMNDVINWLNERIEKENKELTAAGLPIPTEVSTYK